MSTHPPIAERIRILHSMAGASVAEYEEAYRKIKGKGVVPASALAGTGAVGLRATSVDTKPLEEVQEKIERTRETSDLMWRMGNYKTIDCECGTRLRIPPHFRALDVRCPHCGRIHPVP